MKGILAVASAVTIVGVWWSTRSADLPQCGGPMSQEAYVWQRSWGDSVREAIGRAAADVTGFVVLKAEVAWEGELPRVLRIPVDFPALSILRRPVGLALRIGPYTGSFDSAGGASHFLSDLAASLKAEALHDHPPIHELQLDFDCAESKLDGYRVWLESIRRSVSPTLVTITALPSWLDRAAFARLAHASDGFVLQVHSLERPTGPDATATLCDVVSARLAVERAARVGVPFRVALPIYGYLAAFDSQGRLLGISAEGPNTTWPPDVTVRELRADSSALASLVAEWSSSRPANCTGIIWYRLPVEGDRLNWQWSTLVSVMRGAPQRPILRAIARRPEPGLLEIDLANIGDGDSVLMPTVIAWTGSTPHVAADAIGGYTWDRAGPGRVEFRPQPGSLGVRLAAGQRMTIGWIRFRVDTEVRFDVLAARQ